MIDRITRALRLKTSTLVFEDLGYLDALLEYMLIKSEGGEK